MNLFKYWRFRSAHPTLNPGDDIEVYLTAFDPESGRGQARIGDSVLEVEGASADQIDSLVRLHVESFNAEAGKGSARAR
ncbi:MAG: DUF7513 family protein [Wenzhouxiangella sp.]